MSAEVIVQRGWSSPSGPEIADLDADGARDDQCLFELAARFAGFKLDDEAFTRSGRGSKPGLRPAKRFASFPDSSAEIAQT